MRGFPKKDDVIDAVIDGINTAKYNYKFWTADEFLSSAPSKFLSIHVSQELAKLDNTPEIFIDATIADILRCSLPQRDAFKSFMSEHGLAQDTISLTLDERFEHKTDNDSVSRVIVSLNNGVRNVQDDYLHEIETICKMLNRDHKDDSTLDYGVFAFYSDISSSARKKTDKRVEELKASFDVIVSQYNNLKSSFKGGQVNVIDNIGEWCVGCYIIEPTFN